MRKVSNRKVIRKLSLKILKANWKKNIAVIVAISLTTIMFTTLFSVGMSMLETSRKSTMRQIGVKSMGGFKYGRACDYAKLKKDAKTKNISYRIIVGDLVDSRLDGLRGEVYYATKDNAEGIFSTPTQGRMPVEKDEMALSTLVMEKLGIQKKVGEKFRLKIQVNDRIMEDEFRLSGYWEGDPVAMAQMVFVSKEYQERVASEPEISYYDTDGMKLSGYRQIDFDFFSSFNIEKQVKELLSRNGYDADNYEYGVNWAYENATVDMTSMILYLIILFVIMFSGYLIIYNIFYISVSSDIREYGLLKTVGTSGKQLKRIVKLQAFYLSFIGIPIGLMLGTGVARFVFPILLGISDLDSRDLSISVHPFIYIGASLLSLITIEIGCWKPARTACRVSPIEAVNYQEKCVTKKKRKRTKKVSTIGLACSNFGRDKKKVLVVVLSLSLSIVLTNGIYSVVKSMDLDKFIAENVIGDFNIYNKVLDTTMIYSEDNIGVRKDDVDYVSKLDGVTDCFKVYCDLSADLELTEERLQRIEKKEPKLKNSRKKEELKWRKEQEGIGYEYYGISEGVLEDLTLLEGSIDLEKWKTGNYLVGYSYQLFETSSLKLIDFFKIGDKVSVTLQNGQKKEYTVMAIAQMPHALSIKSFSLVGGNFIVPEEEFIKMEGNADPLFTVLNVKDSEMDSVCANIKSYVAQSDHLRYVDKKMYLDSFYEFIQTIEIVGGALVFVLAIIGIMNYANSVITGIWKRTKELAMMQAVGLTNKQLCRMLIYEGMLYGLVTIASAVFIYIFLGGPAIKYIASEVWFFEYHFTLMPIILCLPVVLLISGIIPFLSCHIMEKKSVIERMKTEY